MEIKSMELLLLNKSAMIPSRFGVEMGVSLTSPPYDIWQSN